MAGEKKEEMSPEEKEFIEQLISLLDDAQEEKKKESSFEEKEFIEQSLYEIARSCFQ